MGDGDFQQQLHCLKDRVNALTLQYSPRRPDVAPAAPISPPQPSEDLFATQLRDIKAHMEVLQDSISKCEASMRQQPTSIVHVPFGAEMATQSRQTLPSGPLFWAIVSSMRSDIAHLDGHVAGLEKHLDFLEERVDKLEPDQFTPAGSTASHDENGGVQLSEQKPSEDLLGASVACLPELCPEGEGTVYGAQAGPAEQNHRRTPSLQIRQDDAFEWQWPLDNHWTDAGKQWPYATPMFGDQMSHNIYAPYRQPKNSIPVYSEGLAFRDRELDRMDDQLKVVQESLKSSEELAAANDTTMSDMRTQIETLQADNQRMAAQIAQNTRNREWDDELIRRLRRELEESKKASRARDKERQREIDGRVMTIADREFALRYWKQRCEDERSALQHSIADRDQALQRWEESYYSLSDAWRLENERAIALGSKLDHYRSDRQKELEHVHRSYEREMDKLKEFCEQKDAVIVRQERVMSRGGKLLEEKDAELDHLQRRLRIVEDDMQHETRQQRRMARLLSEKQTELERLRSSNDVKERAAGEDERELRQHSTTEAVDDVEPAGDPPRDPRRVFDHYRERQHDDPDGSEASAREAARTGSPRRRRLRRHESSRHLRDHHTEHRHSRHERRPTPPPLPNRHADHEDRRERPAADLADLQPELPDRRRARFLDDTISFKNPPLPAPVAARKMASEADLHNQNDAMRGDGAGRILSKHQSMQELLGARRRLQAYVETEGESDAEKDGRGAPGLV